MGCFGGERPRTKAIPNIKLFEHELQRINQLMDQLKQLRNDVWRAVSRVFRTKNVRRLAQSVNSWFSKHFPGQPRRKSTSVGEDKPPLNMDQNAALLIKSCAEMFSQTNVPVTKPEANEDLRDELLKSKEDLPIRKMKKVRFQIQEEMDQLDASLTEVLKWSARIKHNDVKKSRRQLFRPQISRPLSPREDPEGAAAGDIRCQTPAFPMPVANIPVLYDSEDEIEDAIEDIKRNMGDGPDIF